MRDKNRIEETIQLLREAWNLVPDWRFGQLVLNVIGQDPGLFYYEENTVNERLREFIKYINQDKEESNAKEESR